MGHRKKLLIGCDGDQIAGLGHVNRCLALGVTALELGWKVEFLGRYSQTASKMILEAGADLSNTAIGVEHFEFPTLAEEKGKDGRISSLLIDSYRITSDQVRKLKTTLPEVRLILVDDTAKLDSYPCDAVLNFTIGAKTLDYPKGEAEYFLGTEFFPVGKWLAEAKEKRSSRATHPAGNNQKVAITMGGNDAWGITKLFTEATSAACDDCDIRVIIDPGHPDVPDIDRVLTKHSGDAQRLVPQGNLGSVLEWASLVFSSGGLTKYETQFLGIPTGVVDFSDIQSADTALFADREALVRFGEAESLDPPSFQAQVRSFLENSVQLAALSENSNRIFSDNARKNLTRIISGSSTE